MLHFAALHWQLPLRILHPKPAHLPARSECVLTDSAHEFLSSADIFCLANCLYWLHFVVVYWQSPLRTLHPKSAHRCECELTDSAPFVKCCGFGCYHLRAETLGRCSECSCIIARATWSARSFLVTSLEGCLRSATSFSARDLRLPSSAALLTAMLPPQLIERACHDRTPF